MPTAMGSRLAGTGDFIEGKAEAHAARKRSKSVRGEVEPEVGDHLDDGGGDAGHRRREGDVAAQPLDVRRTEEDEQEAGHEGHPRCEQRSEHARHPRVERSGVAERSEERHELHHHDQRAGRAFGQREAAGHLPGASQP